MTLTVPVLDDRDFQSIVDEAKKRIPHYCKQWTDHNVSDPGVTMIELFAWMTETVLYRLNQVPDLHTIKFMEMMGVKLQAPVPAQVPVTFWLSAPQATAVTIPAGTEVASTQTETERSIIFTTNKDFDVLTPQVTAVLTRQNKSYGSQNLRSLEAGFQGFNIFSDQPLVGDALYFGFDNNLSHHILGLDFDFDSAGGAGIDPSKPPYEWQASTGQVDQHWQPCEVDLDTTQGLNSNGRIRIHLPKMGKYQVNKSEQFWVRAIVKEISREERKEGMRPYQSSPRLRKVSLASWGGAVQATHSQTNESEFLGQSDGTPGQRFYLQVTPILERMSGETLIVQSEGETPQEWLEVSDFADAGAQDQQFTLDNITGELRFGPAIRQPDGTIKLYGAVPPRRANLLFSKYRTGGGQIGNIHAGVLNTLKTAIPYISRVSNRVGADGGLDAEALENAMTRMPALLRSRERAVTESDYEFLAVQALPAAIGRVRCLQPRPSAAGRVAPGQIYVLVVPRVKNPGSYLSPQELHLAEKDQEVLKAYLDERRLLTTRLSVLDPAYTWVTAKVQLRAAPGIEPEDVEQIVLARLYRYLNPLTGGPDGKGWEFGRDLFVSDVYQCLQGTPHVQFIRNVEMFAAQPGGNAKGKAVEELEVVAHGVVASGIHEIEFV